MTLRHALSAAGETASRAEMYRAWHAAQRAGMSYDHALESLSPRSESVEQLRRALLDARKRGVTITDALKPLGSNVVEPFERAILVLGEEAGALEKALNTLSLFFHRETVAILRLQSKLTYPLLLALVVIVFAPLPLVFSGRT